MEDIDSRNGATNVEEKMDELRRYVEENIELLRRQISNSNDAKIAESSDVRPNTENPLVSKLNSEVEFLRDELKRRSDDFQQREASLCKIIEILHSENTSIRHADSGINTAPYSASAGVDPTAWKKPRKTAVPRVPAAPASIESANPFTTLRELNDSAPNDSQIPTNTGQQFNNVTQRKHKRRNNTPDNANTTPSERVVVPLKSKPAAKNIIVLGDSMVKGLQSHKMSGRNRVSCVSIGGMSVEEMLDVGRGLCKREPHLLIVTCGTNSLFPRPKKTLDGPVVVHPMSPTDIVAKMREMKTTLEAEFTSTQVIFSKLITRNDIANAQEKIDEVNDLISQSNLAHIDHENITSDHLNGSKLHLNQSGDRLLATNIINFIKTFYD